MMLRIFEFAVALLILAVIFLVLTVRPVPESVKYGVSFSTLNAEELGLNWRAVYTSALDELGVRAFRIPAYWPRTEVRKDEYDWSELDFQLREAEARGAKVVLALGRRLPRWPECHIPEWARALSWNEQKDELRAHIRAVVERYRQNTAITHWQVENEPYLYAFATEHCGKLDTAFLQEEIALVRSLDERPILVTDSGNLGLWLQPYRDGDAFGTSLYMYFWNPELGQFKTKLPALIYRLKERIAEVIYGQKPTFLIELSLEPWLTQPIASTPIDVQLQRMDIEKFNEILAYARETSFEEQYLWGLEWWYYMKEHEHPEFWHAARELYSQSR